MKTKAVIIDDEQNNIDNLQLLLTEYSPDVEVAATAKDAETGKQIIIGQQPELVFLDIQMPGKSGFDLLRELNNIDFEIIFVTAYQEFAIHAMKFSAVDYLLKPVDPKELQAAITRAEKRVGLKSQNKQLENLINLLQKQQDKAGHRIGLTTLKETRFIKPDEIIRCESSNNYTTFYLNSNEEIVVSKPIYEYEQLLNGYGFIRCHQSHIINKQYVKSWVKELGGYILMSDDKQVPISRSKKDLLKDFLQL
jgi:two-component system LytT family response regulator